MIIERLTQERKALEERMRASRLREQSLGDRIDGLEGSRRNALSAAESRIQMAIERVRAAERTLEAAEASLITAKLNLDRQEQLNQKGLSSTRSLELAVLDHARAVADVDRAKADLNAARNDQIALEADRQRIETDFRASIEDARASRAAALAEIGSVAASLQQMDVRIARQVTQQIVAPRDGTILRLLAQPGSELVKAGDPLAILVPDAGTRVVELWVNGNDMPLISPGNKVRLQFEGWPAIQFVGWPAVAIGTFGGEVLLVDATDNGQGYFRILAGPDPEDSPWPSERWLRQGVRAHGWVLLNRVRLGYEVWRQLNAFPPFIAMEEPGVTGKEGGKE
jgi:membrane fusion protein, adhesin transport system